MRMDQEQAEQIAYDICSKFNFITEFPGMDKFNLNPLDEHDCIIADAIIYAIQHDRYNQYGTDYSTAYGKLISMIRYGAFLLPKTQNPYPKVWILCFHEKDIVKLL